MINEREASRRFFRKETIIFDLRFDEEENSLSSYQIEMKNQLRHWIEKNLRVVVFMIQKLIKENMTIIKNYNRVTNIVRNALEEVEKEALIESIHDEDTFESTKKRIISKKLLDSSIFIDEKNSLIDD
jgi:histidinol phosphatase-like enzyme